MRRNFNGEMYMISGLTQSVGMLAIWQ